MLKLKLRETNKTRKKNTQNDRSEAQIHIRQCIRWKYQHKRFTSTPRYGWELFGRMNCTKTAKRTDWERVKHNSMASFRCINITWIVSFTMKYHENKHKVKRKIEKKEGNATRSIVGASRHLFFFSNWLTDPGHTMNRNFLFVWTKIESNGPSSRSTDRISDKKIKFGLWFRFMHFLQSKWMKNKSSLLHVFEFLDGRTTPDSSHVRKSVTWNKAWIRISFRNLHTSKAIIIIVFHCSVLTTFSCFKFIFFFLVGSGSQWRAGAYLWPRFTSK